ncbi:DHH family phosphoesterase [Winogradskyella aurantiaca]|uniref:DHH family phosphoesterase n=1 Tax=Winogradskyella aurantiaca TaxID=2219558 RepID=UPI000E1E0276|nr:bifunctional oligoribonuclease/PAP phosphatase NrnA [Winogradskyella aurantiaca]
MEKSQIEAIQLLLKQPKNIVIVPHRNPDGDAMGSTLALYHYLISLGHEASVIAPNDYPEFLKWLPGTDLVKQFEFDEEECSKLIAESEIIFTLDFNDLSRVGNQMGNILETASSLKIMIDHHQQPSAYAKYMYSNVEISSTCEMVYNFIEFLGDESKIDAVIATCLYTGIMTDTGSFRFPSTTSRTLEIAGDLMKRGANHSDIHNQVFDTNSYNRLQLLSCALGNLKILKDYNTAYISLSQEELDKFEFKKGDTEGFVNYGLSIKGIVMAVIFIENVQDDIIKISFRSKGSFSVNDFARSHFNGGGHTNAAGGRSETSLNGAIEKFISILPAYKQQLAP